MSSKKQRPYATVLLAVMTVGFLLVYPWRHAPMFAFLTHVFGAAMIGGLADWYAVTALFTKPLGIGYKTALIPRSKERLIETARTMMTDELLRVPYMYAIIKREQVLRRMITYFLSPDGRAHWERIIHGISQRMADTVELAPLRRELQKALMKGVGHWQATPLIIHFGRLLTERDTAAVLWLHCNRLLRRVLESNGIRPYVIGVTAAMMNRYAEDSFWRELALALGGDSVSPERITDLIQTKGGHYLATQESLDSPMGAYVYRKAVYLIDELECNPRWQRVIETKKERLAADMLDEFTETGLTDSMASLRRMADDGIKRFAEGLLTDEVRLARAERTLLVNLVPWLRKVRRFADTAVVKELATYEPQRLAQIVRSKLHYDLQMIRINGSLVGAVLGGVFYIAAEMLRGSLFV